MKLSFALEIMYTYDIFVDKMKEIGNYLNIPPNLLLK